MTCLQPEWCAAGGKAEPRLGCLNLEEEPQTPSLCQCASPSKTSNSWTIEEEVSEWSCVVWLSPERRDLVRGQQLQGWGWGKWTGQREIFE